MLFYTLQVLRFSSLRATVIVFCLYFSVALPLFAESKLKVNLYCTSNRDGTGACFDESDQSPFDCVAVQGEVVPCKSAAGQIYQCQGFGNMQLACDLRPAENAQPAASQQNAVSEPSLESLLNAGSGEVQPSPSPASPGPTEAEVKSTFSDPFLREFFAPPALPPLP